MQPTNVNRKCWPCLQCEHFSSPLALVCLCLYMFVIHITGGTSTSTFIPQGVSVDKFITIFQSFCRGCQCWSGHLYTRANLNIRGFSSNWKDEKCTINMACLKYASWLCPVDYVRQIRCCDVCVIGWKPTLMIYPDNKSTNLSLMMQVPAEGLTLGTHDGNVNKWMAENK